MAYLDPHLLVNYHGKMPGGEIWSIGFRTIASSPSVADLAIYATYAANQFEVLWNTSSSPKSFNPAAVTMEGCTVRKIDTAGRTISQAEGLPVAPVVGGLTTPTMPNQCTLVASLTTASAGRSFRGRVYLPCLDAGALTAAGRLDPASNVVVNASDFVTGLIAGLNGGTTSPPVTAPLPATRWAIAIQSKVSGVIAAPVTHVKVGDVIDTQRRRRDKLVENYLVAAV